MVGLCVTAMVLFPTHGSNMTISFNTRTINKEISKLGGFARLVKGEGYWYFMEGEAEYFYSQSVYVMYLNSLTVEQWIEEWKDKVISSDFPKDEIDFIELQNKLKGL